MLLFLMLLTFPLFGREVAIFTYRVQGSDPWDRDSIEKGITGSEEAVIYLSDALKKRGFNVTVFGTPPEGSIHSKENANPRYLPLQMTYDKPFDVAIAWRQADAGKRLKKIARAVFFWPHDTPPSTPLSSEEIEAFDGVFWLSHWQREQFIKENSAFSRFESIIGNGIDTTRFGPIQERKNPYSCIWGSNYARGLWTLLSIWPSLRREFKEATLDIYYGWNSWGLLGEKESAMRWLVEKLEPLGVKEHGLVSHKELEEAFSRASFWTYPCQAAETFCITALKAQYAGAIPVIINGSALNETVLHGYKTDSQEDYLPLLLSAMREVKEINIEKRALQRDFIDRNYTWDLVAERVIELAERIFLTQSRDSSLQDPDAL